MLNWLLGAPCEIDVVDEDGPDCVVGRFRSEALARAYAEGLGYDVVAIHEPTGRVGPSRRERQRRDDESTSSSTSAVDTDDDDRRSPASESASDSGSSSDGGSSSDSGGSGSSES